MHRVLFGAPVLFSILGLSACAADSPPAPTAIDSPPIAAPAPETCRGDDCFVRGEDLAKQHADVEARAAFEQGCTGDGATMRNCAALAILLAKGIGGEPDEQRALTLTDKACVGGEGDGCWVHGVLERDVLNDAVRADADFEKACRLGSDRGCDAHDALTANAKSSPSSDASSAPGGMKLAVNDMTIDGFTISKLECQLDNGAGLFGALAIGKTLSTRGDAMKRCTAHATDVTIHWKSKGKAATNIRVESSDAPVKACVERALANTPSPIPGQCTAHVTLTP